MKLRAIPHTFGEVVVAGIARSKYVLLFLAFIAASLLAVGTCVFLIEDEGERLTSAMADAGGYVAIVGLVLGLPALAYAMVTDSTVDQIKDELGRRRRKELYDGIRLELTAFEANLPDHTVQVFLPDIHHRRLSPIYDPDEDGPDEGWGIERLTPQAVTGSAWVRREYLSGKGEELRQAKLRLTAKQLKEYEDLEAVAAAPIYARNRELDPLGVLTVYSKGESPKIGDDSFQVEHEAAAQSLVPIVRRYIAENGALSQRDLDPRGRS